MRRLRQRIEPTHQGLPTREPRRRRAKGSTITPARDHRSGPSRIVANAIAERFVGSIRRKLLDRILIIGQRHAMAVLCRHELITTIPTARTLGQAAPLQPLPRRTTTKIDDVWRRDRFGGLMREYQQVA
jgi:hypothetical protein